MRRLLVTVVLLGLVTGCSTGKPAARPTAAPVSAPSPSPAAPRTVTVVGSGDVLIHPPLWEQAAADAKAAGRAGYDFGPIYANVADYVGKADLAICELETPLAKPEGPFSGWPNFNAPPQVLPTLKQIGYDSCTNANNHSLDQGLDGVKRTADLLDAAGIKHTGTARSAEEAATPLVVTTAAGVKVAQLAYSFGFNGIAKPAGKPWIANQLDVPTILADARKVKAAGADLVILSLHWGVEYDHKSTAEQQAQARTLLASPDIDAILGDHAHVVQPMEKINDKWVIYSMGNQIARHDPPMNDNREGAMPRFTFTEVSPGKWRLSKAEVLPIWMDFTPALRLVNLPAALANPATTAAQKAVYQGAYDRISGFLNLRGASRDGLEILTAS